MSEILTILNSFHWDCWELELIGAIVSELSCVGNVASILVIFATNVSLFTSTIEIRGALNGLDLLMIGWDFGLPIVVVKLETIASFECNVSINEESIPQNLVP